MASSSQDTYKRSGSNESSPERSPKKLKTEKDENRQKEENHSDKKRKQEEAHFFNLKNLVLDTVIALKKVQEEDIALASLDIRNSFKSWTFMDINLSKWEYSCSYLFRHGAHGAGLTRFKTLEALQKCEDLVSKFKMPDVNIVGLGCGPGLDIIGLCSALYEYQVHNCLKITAIDSVCEWSTSIDLEKVFLKESNYGNASELFQQNKVNLSFCHAKVPECEYSRKFIAEADIILMTKFISSLKSIDQEGVVKSIHGCMKQGSFVLLIDSPYIQDHWGDFEVLYRPENKTQYYTIAEESVTWRFGDTDSVISSARLVVFRKK